MFCPKCGKENADDAEGCWNCGRIFEEEVAEPERSEPASEPQFAFGKTVRNFCPVHEHVWPDRCACCNGPADRTHDEQVQLDLSTFLAPLGIQGAAATVRMMAQDVPNVMLGETKGRQLLVQFRVPFCARCRRHEVLANLGLAGFAFGGGIPTLFALISGVVGIATCRHSGGISPPRSESDFSVLGFILFGVIIGIVLALLGFVARSLGNRVRAETCAPLGKAIELEPGGELFGWIHFGNRDFGKEFERMNQGGGAEAT